MGRIFGILCVVAGLWIGAEIYREPPVGHPERTLPQRAGQSVRDSLALEAQRHEQALPE